MVHKVIEANDYGWVTFVCDSVCLEKPYTTYLGSRLAVDDLPFSRLAVDDLPGSRLVNAEMMRQLHAVYGEWLLKDGCWNFVVDHFKGARMLFLNESSTHADLVAMAQEDYNLDMNTESVELTYSLQQMAPDLPPIHVTSDRQVRNLLEITKTHEVRLCVSSFSKMRTVSEERDEDHVGDEAEEGDEAEVGDEADSFASKDALLSELRLTAVRRRFSFRIFKSTKTLFVATCRVSGCQWKVRASVKHGTKTFWVTKYLATHTCSIPDRIAQRKRCTPKYIGRLFIDRVGIIDGDCNVDLELQKCDCGVYQVEKIPCSHAIAAGTAAGVHISTLVWPVYSKDTLFAGYSENIYPCVGQLVEARTCFPPEVKRGPGRQKKSRWQSWLELSRMRGRKPRKQHRVLIIVLVFPFMALRKLSKYIQRHLLPDGLPVFFVKRGGKFYPKSMTFDVLQSENPTITSSALRYSNGLSRICVWLQCVLNLLFVRERALNKQIRDHCDKRLHYLIEFCRPNMRDNAVPDDDVPLRDRYPYSNPMLVLEVHRCIDIIHIHPPNLLRLAKRRYQACMIIPRPTRESSS
ncbi:hypothetical protein IGI04_034618 [Brassica rapa subsp. trilocularis]|uniref:SWIM-type domain-containing protein n=1 Tax=Brassica rapa subsp. trilocularis TaxID=1813537 RepID=A0ABQ7L9A7_BRACM|nr:hypothetical protein IGI04_034618 [Brassica rapa subsp. trilocularis]